MNCLCVIHLHANETLFFLKTRFVPRYHTVCTSVILVQYLSYLSMHTPCMNDCTIFPFVWIVIIHYLNAYLGNRVNAFFINCCSIVPLIYILLCHLFYNSTLSHQMSWPKVWYLSYWTITNIYKSLFTVCYYWCINHAFVMPYWMLTHIEDHLLH